VCAFLCIDIFSILNFISHSLKGTLAMALTLKEVAERLSVNVAQVSQLVRQGALRGSDVRLPGSTRASWRISEEAVEEFLVSRQPKGPAVAAPRPKRRFVMGGTKQIF
jgi:excisionase family DNA binding protein